MTDKVYKLIEDAGRVHNELVKEFERLANICYSREDYNGFNYWLNRANAIQCENYRLVDDINKIIRIEESKET